MIKNVVLLPGDGIGPEVVAEGVKVLNAVGLKYDHDFKYTEGLIGASAINQTGEALPKQTINNCAKADAILLGAIGDLKYDNDPKAKVRPEQGLLKLRESMELFANVRPVVSYPSLTINSPLKEEIIANSDFVIFRELTGGIYFGDKGRNLEGNGAFDLCSYSKIEIERIAHMAFKAAQKRQKRLTLVDKANVLETSRLWREVVQEIAGDYKDVKVDMLFVDNAAMQLVLNPSRFDVILTENMFGDILSDIGSVISGSLGLLPSASRGKSTSMYEPVHGSYPQAAGKDIANPMATILSVAMMLEDFDMMEEAQSVKNAVDTAMEMGIVTEDISMSKSYGTIEVGDCISYLIDSDSEYQPTNRENIFLGASTII